VNTKYSILFSLVVSVAIICENIACSQDLIEDGHMSTPSDTLHATADHIVEHIADWIVDHQEASLPMVAEQANEYLKQYGWQFQFDIGDGLYPGNKKTLDELLPLSWESWDRIVHIVPFYIPGPDSTTIALRIEVPQQGIIVGGYGSIEVPITGINGRTVSIATDAGLVQMVLPPTFDLGELTIFDRTFSRVIGNWSMEFNGLPPHGISRDATKVYYCIGFRSEEDPERAVHIDNWWRMASGGQYSLRNRGQQYHGPFLILTHSHDGLFSFETAYEEISAQRVEYVSDAPNDDFVYWRFVFDDGLIYVMGWPGIIT